MSKFIDLTGQHFGSLTVVERSENAKDGGAKWLCKCDCGNESIVSAGNLKSGHTQSCGCYEREQTIKRSTKHGKCGTRIYQVWRDMKNRCCRPLTHSYKTHGARGISVCAEWLHDFQAFYDWAMANGYADNLTLDRIDTNGNYEPSNCRWATQKEQANNKRNNHLVTYKGETKTITQWAETTGIKRQTIQKRLKNGWSVERTLETGVI